jgi:hypothetical protein
LNGHSPPAQRLLQSQNPVRVQPGKYALGKLCHHSTADGRNIDAISDNMEARERRDKSCEAATILCTHERLWDKPLVKDAVNIAVAQFCNVRRFGASYVDTLGYSKYSEPTE